MPCEPNPTPRPQRRLIGVQLPATPEPARVVAPSGIYRLPATTARCRGWKEIAARVESTARLYPAHAGAVVAWVNWTKGTRYRPGDKASDYAMLAVDPLPIRCYQAEVWCYTLRLDEWVARRNAGVLPDGAPLHVLRGYQDIGVALGNASTRSMRRWAITEWDPLPIHAPGQPLGSTPSVWAYTSAVRDWIDRHDLPIQVAALQRGYRAWVPKASLAVGEADVVADMGEAVGDEPLEVAAPAASAG